MNPGIENMSGTFLYGIDVASLVEEFGMVNVDRKI